MVTSDLVLRVGRAWKGCTTQGCGHHACSCTLNGDWTAMRSEGRDEVFEHGVCATTVQNVLEMLRPGRACGERLWDRRVLDRAEKGVRGTTGGGMCQRVSQINLIRNTHVSEQISYTHILHNSWDNDIVCRRGGLVCSTCTGCPTGTMLSTPVRHLRGRPAWIGKNPLIRLLLEAGCRCVRCATARFPLP